MKRILVLIFITVFMITSSYGQGLGLKSITGKAGIVLPEDPWDSGFQIGAKADLGEIMENVHLNPVLEYWSSGYSIGGVDFSLSNFQLGAEAHYALNNIKGLYAGAGLVLNFVSIEVPTFVGFGNTGTATASNTDFGITALVGYEFPLGGMAGVAEAKYNLTDVSALGVTFGVKFDMSK
ncbi:MAG: hypothetical protein D8M58_19760 [Calditrichaeota bacterium]|nr:MAG: hypothetical protein DWQ03_14505 [Calditrichota bacterium]MBL1207646.1 hypothetical protein [Calditrichota bacterium]NOG47479.1 hypothetical protein [Calditrichota bacterium]